MTSVLVPDQVGARVEPDQYIRNEMLVTPYTTNALDGAANQLLAQRGKELFSSVGSVGVPTSASIPISTITAPRWRFAAHTSPNLDTIQFWALCARPTSSGAAAARLEIYNSAGTTLLTSIDLAYGGGYGMTASTSSSSSPRFYR